jgi:hypothetical protein
MPQDPLFNEYRFSTKKETFKLADRERRSRKPQALSESSMLNSNGKEAVGRKEHPTQTMPKKEGCQFWIVPLRTSRFRSSR